MIRSVYPATHIICALGSMDITREGSPWPGYVSEAVEGIKEETGDDKLYTCFFPFTGRYGHPRIEEQQVMADSLIHFIDRNIAW